MLKAQKSIFRTLLKLAKKRNIFVKNTYLPESIKGLWYMDDECELILLDFQALEDLNKRNFVFAHELGHSILHRRKLNNALYWENSFNNEYKKTIESEANKFAQNLINKLNRCYNLYPI
jgi:Zn-dependent peptidase ImmA (M78 family)